MRMRYMLRMTKIALMNDPRLAVALLAAAAVVLYNFTSIAGLYNYIIDALTKRKIPPVRNKPAGTCPYQLPPLNTKI